MKIIEYHCKKDIEFIRNYLGDVTDFVYHGTHYSLLIEDNNGIQKHIKWFKKPKIG